jgi:HK97 family phage prohead protease
MDLIKSIGGTVKDVDPKSRMVTGYFSSFDIKDSDGDIIRKGAYAKTILENGPGSKNFRIKHLVDHDKTDPASILRVLKEDDFGLYYEGWVGTHTQAEDFLKMAQEGYITEHSVHIIPVKQQTNPSAKANDITETKLKEGSSLRAWGANEFTPFMGLKSAEDVVAMFNRIQKSLKTSDFSDETFIELEKQYKILGELLKATQPVKATEPVKSQEPQVDYYTLFKNAALNGN